MKTLLALEELIRSYNGITALDNFKALECLKILKELDLKYEGFGEDIEISPQVFLEKFLEEEDNNTVTILNKRYISFNPMGYSIFNQNGNCLIELNNSENSFYISDRQICLLYEMISDIFEYGEINSSGNWKSKDSILDITIHDISNATDCIVSFIYNKDICELLNSKNNFNEKLIESTELVLDINTVKLAKILRRILLNYRSQEIVMISLPDSKKVNYSKALKNTLSSERYFHVFSSLEC